MFCSGITPYELFATSVEEFINQAATSLVLAIKMNPSTAILQGSSIVSALNSGRPRRAKQVMALVELKGPGSMKTTTSNGARQLERSGVHCGLWRSGVVEDPHQNHVVVRKEKERLRSYVHIGTGNYNSKTSGLLTPTSACSRPSGNSARTWWNC